MTIPTRTGRVPESVLDATTSRMDGVPEKPFATVFLGSGLFKYCFFLSEEMLYPGSRFRTADELLDLFIRQLLEAHETPEVTIAWQGGEPTLLGLKRAPTPS